MSTANVVIHQSQFPENVRRDLLESLRTRRVNHKFHYDSVKQTNRWLALHQAYAPSRNDPDCMGTYDCAFAEASKKIRAARVFVLGLGCGGGQKDARVLRHLFASGKEVMYQPLDVSVAMVLVARQTVSAVVPYHKCAPFVCDLATTTDLPQVLRTREFDYSARLVTFFGMIPNFEPADILPKLASLVRAEDWLLFSANLAPGSDYAAGVARILPQYDNDLTRKWLLAFLLDLGVERSDGELRFMIDDSAALQRVVARFHFARTRRIEAEGEMFEFRPGDGVQLFFSYRYSPALAREALFRHGLEVQHQWLTPSGEEGVFLCRRQ
jgi:L-histidine N-alpha-methyltransferase